MRSDDTRKAGILLAAAALPGLTGCLPMKIGNMSLDRAFSDGRVRAALRAALRHDFKEVDAQIKAGADLNMVGAEGILPIIWVMHAQDVPALEYLLQKGMNPNLADGKIHRPAVVWAVKTANPKILETLLKHGGDPNSRGQGNTYPLETATELMETEELTKGEFKEGKAIFELLLKYGADLNMLTTDGENLAQRPAGLARFKTVHYLLDRGLTKNLEGLAETLVDCEYGETSRRARDQALARLKAMGVKIPKPPKWVKNEYGVLVKVKDE